MTADGLDRVRADLPALLPRLWRFAVVLTGSRQAADDLVQATCVRALERAHQFQPGTFLDRWTFSILASIWRNQRRADAVRFGTGQVDAIDALTVEIEPGIEASILTRQVLTAIGALPEGQRSAMLLVYGEGYSYKEAANALDIPLGTLMSRLGAGKQALAHLRGPAAPAPNQIDGGRP